MHWSNALENPLVLNILTELGVEILQHIDCIVGGSCGGHQKAVAVLADDLPNIVFHLYLPKSEIFHFPFNLTLEVVLSFDQNLPYGS